jgi:hypothetical protein
MESEGAADASLLELLEEQAPRPAMDSAAAAATAANLIELRMRNPFVCEEEEPPLSASRIADCETNTH